jgi:capsular exopolysaccharide synthesis family protein
VLQSNLSSLSQQLDGILLSQAQSATTLTVIDTAQVPASPVQPSLRRNLLVGLIIGLLLAAGAIALLHYLDDTLQSPREVEARLGLPILAGIPRHPSREQPLVLADAPGGRGVEAFALLRATLLARAAQRKGGTLLVASGGAGEGKSTIVANLAVAAARAGKRVVLVDADLRRPSLHTLFGLGPAPGLADVLDGTEAQDAVLRSTRVDGLRLVCCGRLPPNPSELLASPRMGEFLAAAASAADLVMLDSPPALLVGDAVTLAGQVGGILLVIDSDLTTMRAASRTLRLLQLAGGSPLGLVINRLDARISGYGAAAYMRHPRAGLGASGKELAADSAAMTGRTH